MCESDFESSKLKRKKKNTQIENVLPEGFTSASYYVK